MTADVHPSKILVRDFPIRLGQFLKLADFVQDGLEAKIRIQDGEVRVNGEIEVRRGRQLHHGDVIDCVNNDPVVAWDANHVP